MLLGYFWGGLDALPWDWADSDVYATSANSIRNWVYQTMNPDQGSVVPPRYCATRADCNPSQWCIAGVCGPPPSVSGCRGREDCESAVCSAARNVGTGVDIMGRCEDGDPAAWDPDTLPPGAECLCFSY